MNTIWLLGLGICCASVAAADFSFVDAATGVDNPNQDGVFDGFTEPNYGSIDNNGGTSFRTAMEYDISSIPAGSTVHSATLTIRIDAVNGTRTLALNSYSGDGHVQLADFSRDGFATSMPLSPPGNQTLVFNVSGAVQSLVDNGDAYAGFNFREDPANTANFLVFDIEMTSPGPVLTVNYEAVPEPSVIGLAGVALLGLAARKGFAYRRAGFPR